MAFAMLLYLISVQRRQQLSPSTRITFELPRALLRQLSRNSSKRINWMCKKMNGRMDGPRTDRPLDGRPNRLDGRLTDGRMHRMMDGADGTMDERLTDGRTNEWTDGRTEGWMKKWMNGWTFFYIKLSTKSKIYPHLPLDVQHNCDAPSYRFFNKEASQGILKLYLNFAII